MTVIHLKAILLKSQVSPVYTSSTEAWNDDQCQFWHHWVLGLNFIKYTKYYPFVSDTVLGCVHKMGYLHAKAAVSAWTISLYLAITSQETVLVLSIKFQYALPVTII